MSRAQELAVDSSAAQRMPGVLAVLDRSSLGEYDVHLVADTSDNRFITTPTLSVTWIENRESVTLICR